MHEPGGERGGAAATGVAAEKARLRRSVLRTRRGISPQALAAAARSLRDAVLDLPEAQMAGTVAAYYSIGTEPGTRGLVYALWKRGSYVILPVLRPDGDLDWASYEGPESLTVGPRGVLQPIEPPRGPGAVAHADLVVVPALAVDVHGNRLGRGGGGFDRALARVGPRVPVVALLHDGELLERVPTEPHDRQVPMVVLPSRGVVRLSGR